MEPVVRNRVYNTYQREVHTVIMQSTDATVTATYPRLLPTTGRDQLYMELGWATGLYAQATECRGYTRIVTVSVPANGLAAFNVSIIIGTFNSTLHRGPPLTLFSINHGSNSTAAQTGALQQPSVYPVSHSQQSPSRLLPCPVTARLSRVPACHRNHDAAAAAT